MFERAATGDGRAITLLLVVGGMLTAPGRMGSPYLPRSAPVAQGIEQRFPKPCVAGSNPAGGAAKMLVTRRVRPGEPASRRWTAAPTPRGPLHCGRDARRPCFRSTRPAVRHTS